MIDETHSRVGSPQAPWRLGIDVGGTFTDLVLFDASGHLSVVKTATTPAEPTEGILKAVQRAADYHGLTMEALLAGCALIVHGSTIATNCLLEAKGAKVGLLCTRGFRDSLAIRRGIRENAWDHRTPYAKTLVARRWRRGIDERIDKHGNIKTALDTEQLETEIAALQSEGVESVAVCLFNSFLNDEHERAAGQALERSAVSWHTLSSEIAPIMGEYERTSTAVVNAYVAPRVVSYLAHLEQRLREHGYQKAILVVQNNAGVQSIDQVRNKPASLLLSGPAAATGALGAIAGAIGESNLISVEVGGTSCDVLILDGGETHVSDSFDIAGYHVGLSAANVHTIGAGGGTLAGCDSAGMLWAGPSGAGAIPGPACYGRGGDTPTVTDAQLVLGRLQAGVMGDVSVSLDVAPARTAIDDKLAQALGVSVERAAAGVIELVIQAIAHAVEHMTTALGKDPRRFTLVAGGGAGPMLGAEVARRLGCKRVYVPRLAGALCAFGMTVSNVRQEHYRVQIGHLTEVSISQFTTVVEQLHAKATAELAEQGFGPQNSTLVTEFDIRYPGQIAEIRTPVAAYPTVDVAAIREQFEQRHEQLYGYRNQSSPVELTGVRVIACGILEGKSLPKHDNANVAVAQTDHRGVYFDGEWHDTPVFTGQTLRPGTRHQGPVIVEEETTTVVVSPRDVLSVDDHGNYVIDIVDGDQA